MSSYWCTFAKTGDPNGAEVAGRPLDWPAFTQGPDGSASTGLPIGSSSDVVLRLDVRCVLSLLS
jgi:hypothetical protein